MAVNDRITWFYELGRAQADHEQQISAELATRGGLLAALIGLIAVGLTEMWHFHGRCWWLILACGLLVIALTFLSFASAGMRYERPENARDWEAWANREEAGGKTKEQVNDALEVQLFQSYAACVGFGMDSNDTKAKRLNWAFGLSVASLLCLLLGLLFG
jgi:hypothetical protein